MAVVDAFESGIVDLPDFYFTGDDYRYRFEPEAKQRFLDLLRERFNSGVSYKGRALKWDTVIEQKTVELGRYLVGRAIGLDFSKPSPNLSGVDDSELRRRILSLSLPEARRLGIGKSTLHYLRKRAKKGPMLKTHSTVTRRLIVDVSQAPRLAQKSLKSSALTGDAVVSNAKSHS
jgi:GNAT superfamily N-acetyltransferase